MNRRYIPHTVILTALLIMLTLPTWAGTVSGQEDVTPPQVVSASIEPSIVSTSRGPATLFVTIHATDDLSGVRRIYYRFQPVDATPSVGQLVDAYTDKSDAECSGTPTDLTCRIPIELPQYASTGEWVPKWITKRDMVGNISSTVVPPQTDRLGGPTFVNEPIFEQVYLPQVSVSISD